MDEVWQREGPAQGQNGVIDQPCQEGVLLIFQLHRGKRGERDEEQSFSQFAKRRW